MVTEQESGQNVGRGQFGDLSDLRLEGEKKQSIERGSAWGACWKMTTLERMLVNFAIKISNF